jgi:hypothetical protein
LTEPSASSERNEGCLCDSAVINADTFNDVSKNSSDTGDADFGQALAVVAPRRAMVGIRFEF